MKSVLISIQPYWVFLIIAKKLGWNIKQEKTIEVRKSHPKDVNWDKVAKIYCSQDKKSFSRIPKEYQPLMKQFLSKVIGEFVCNKFTDLRDMGGTEFFSKSCMTYDDWRNYTDYTNHIIWAWHISNLVIFDKPRELSEFSNGSSRLEFSNTEDGFPLKWSGMKRPPQSWCYVESEVTK